MKALASKVSSARFMYNSRLAAQPWLSGLCAGCEQCFVHRSVVSNTLCRLPENVGWYMETAYRPLHALLPCMNGVSLGVLSAQASVVQAMAALRIPNFDDHLLVIRAIAPTHQVAYCFANYEAGLDLYIRPLQGLPGGHYRGFGFAAARWTILSAKLHKSRQ